MAFSLQSQPAEKKLKCNKRTVMAEAQLPGEKPKAYLREENKRSTTSLSAETAAIELRLSWRRKLAASMKIYLH